MAQIGTIRLQTQNSGTVSVPVFDTGDSGSDVYEFVRVQTASGTGFIPVVDPASASFPYLRVQSQNQGVVAVHNETSLGASSATWDSLSDSEAYWQEHGVECYYDQTNDGSGNEIYNAGANAVNDAMSKFFNNEMTSIGTIYSSGDTAYTTAAGRRFKFIQENNAYRHYVEEVNENAYHFLSYIAVGADVSSANNFHYYHWHTTKNGLSGSAIVLREPGTQNYEIADILDGNDLPSDGSASSTGPYDVSGINGTRDIIGLFDESTGQNPVESKYGDFYFD